MEIVKTTRVYVTNGNKQNVQLWMPIPKNSLSDIRIIIDGRVVKYSPLIGDSHLNIFTMIYFDIPEVSNYLTVKIIFEYPKTIGINVPKTSEFMKIALEEDFYVDYSKDSVRNLVNQIIKNKNIQNNKMFVKKVVTYLNEEMRYEYNPKTRVASEVAKTLRSDCGGYSSLLCAILRYQNIPCHICFGFRGDKDNKYHTTVIWFDGQKWIREDINDMQDNQGVIRTFVPMTIGSGINIKTDRTPEFPKQVLHLQHSLVWIKGHKPKKVVQSFKVLK